MCFSRETGDIESFARSLLEDICDTRTEEEVCILIVTGTTGCLGVGVRWCEWDELLTFS